jgi:hypothetical protein
MYLWLSILLLLLQLLVLMLLLLHSGTLLILLMLLSAFALVPWRPTWRTSTCTYYLMLLIRAGCIW